jgi:transaldolase
MTNSDKKIIEFLKKDLNEQKVTAKKDPFWESLRKTGTELWLDTGDIDEAMANWTAEMSALTTNNTLLNNEIQKGIYDNFIAEAKDIVKNLPQDERVKEIAFMLNARHGLRLAARFGGFVSVELHTDTANDLGAINYYGKRFHEICPDQFIVKVPLTATGLLGARSLKESGIKINFTLGFSARQNVIITALARPDYVNVFLGRVGAFIINNKLGDGTGAGEMAVLSSQKWTKKLSENNSWLTKQIAASLRNFEQLEMLAGTDVFTMPPKVAAAGRAALPGKFTSRTGEIYNVGLNDPGKAAHIEKFWIVNEKVQKFAASLSNKVPASANELITRAHEAGCGDMFPHVSTDEANHIESDGKIPVYERWKNRIEDNTLAPDTLLTLAGLASFTADQRMLDERIKKIIG